MLIKAGVSIENLERNTRRALSVAQEALDPDGEELVITATADGNHGDGSLHYGNRAFDFRFPENDPVGVVTRLRAALGKDFDVIGEANHIHVEYDPK